MEPTSTVVDGALDRAAAALVAAWVVLAGAGEALGEAVPPEVGNFMNTRRLIRHLIFPHLRLKRSFPLATLTKIERAVHEAESTHGGEIRFAIESAFPLADLRRGQSARARALEVFSELRVWDTEHNNGVLIYVLLADRNVEIVADRGIHKRVQQAEWEAICRDMERAFRAGDFEDGALTGIRGTATLLSRHFPQRTRHANELPDQPFVR